MTCQLPRVACTDRAMSARNTHTRTHRRADSLTVCSATFMFHYYAYLKMKTESAPQVPFSGVAGVELFEQSSPSGLLAARFLSFQINAVCVRCWSDHRIIIIILWECDWVAKRMQFRRK
jgi:hypothetical protein